MTAGPKCSIQERRQLKCLILCYSTYYFVISQLCTQWNTHTHSDEYAGSIPKYPRRKWRLRRITAFKRKDNYNTNFSAIPVFVHPSQRNDEASTHKKASWRYTYIHTFFLVLGKHTKIRPAENYGCPENNIQECRKLSCNNNHVQ